MRMRELLAAPYALRQGLVSSVILVDCQNKLKLIKKGKLKVVVLMFMGATVLSWCRCDE